MTYSCQLRSYLLITGLIFTCSWCFSQGVNAYARVVSISGATLTISNVNEMDDSFDNGDRVIIMQMQDDVLGNTSNSDAFGGLGSINSAGVYEVANISTVTSYSGSPNSIALQQPLSQSFNTCSNCRVQIITYPTLGSPDYTTSFSMQPQPWDGEKGGVLAFEVPETLFLGHNISANSMGFRGGNRSNNWGGPSCEISVFRTSSANYATKGESIFLNTDVNYTAGRARMLNGGGGGSSHNGGGGGGGNYTAGGQGGPGWSSGSCLPGSGGLGGLALSGYISPNRIYLGGGGGGGQQNNSVGTVGGNGGGIIMIRAARLETMGNVKILSNGASCTNSGNDGAGGGGAGGSILLEIPEFISYPSRTLQISANGGNGGSVNNSGLHAGGGGGGQGTIIFTGALPTGDVTYNTSAGTGGCNVLNCSSRADNGDGVDNIGILSGMPSFLDLEWLSFEVKAGAGNAVELTWKVRADTDAALFTIERSFDLQQWQSELNMPATISNQGIESYSVQVPKMGYGRSTYYRIHRLDVAGNLSTSPMRSFVPVLSEGLIKNPYPNPASEYIDIETIAENVSFKLLAADGRLIESFTAKGVLRLECNQYGSGVYFLECTSGGNRELYRLVFK